MENEYNKRFKNKEMSNDDFDVEGLWDNIADELDTPLDKTPLGLWTKLGGAFLLLVLLAGFGYMFFDFSDINTVAQNEQISLEENQNRQEENTAQMIDVSKDLNKGDIAKNESISSKLKTANINKNNTQTEQRNSSIDMNNRDNSLQTNAKEINAATLSNSSITPSEINTTKKANSSKAKIKNKNQASSTESISKNEAIIAENLTEKEVINSQEKALFKEKVNEKNTSADSVNSPRIIKKTSLLKDNIENLTAFIPSIADSLLYTSIREIKSQKRVNKDADKTNKFLLEGSVYGGMNFTDFKFKSVNDDSISTQKNLNENAIIGQTYGLNISALHKGVRVNTGVEYHNLWTKFATQSQMNTTALQEQAVTLVVIDSIGNTLSREMRDTTVNAVTTHNIEHYNNYQIWSIPLEIGLYRAREKWSYGVSAGTSFNFLTNQSGRTLNQTGELIDFDKTSDNTLIQSFSMSLRANAFIAYHLNEKVRLSLAPKWSLTRHDIFNSVLQSEVQQFGLTLGLRSTF